MMRHAWCYLAACYCLTGIAAFYPISAQASSAQASSAVISAAISEAQATGVQEYLLLAGGALPLCSSINTKDCIGAAPVGRRAAPDTFSADANGQRELEVVDFNASKNTAAKAIYLQFVAMAKSAHLARTGKSVQRPRIGILTSAASDPFDPVDFYLGAFEQAGAKAQWLPLDAAVRASFGKTSFGKNCDAIAGARTALTGALDRAEIYPDLARIQRSFCLDRSQLGKILADLDGLFFNGGDQSLSKATWFDGAQPIAEFAQLQARVKARTLAIGGTSAGTAVMSAAAMITNGTSAVALKRGAKARPAPPLDCSLKRSCPTGLIEDDLTYERSGGLGLFALGILDTHFAARDRQGRLAQLLIDSGTRFGFGVDETTALIVAESRRSGDTADESRRSGDTADESRRSGDTADESNGSVRLRAIGAGSVWIFDAKGVKDAATLAKNARLLKPGEVLIWQH